MTYRIAAAGALAALVLWNGCASSAPKLTEAAPVEATNAPEKPQPKVLQRPAPSAQEIESPLKSGEGEQLPVIVQGDTPVGEGGAPRPAPPQVPPARPGGTPAVEEVIEMPTRELHGAFPGVGATPSTKPAENARANDAVAQRIADIEKQLAGLKESAAKPAAGPDPAAIAAVQARLDELKAKIGKVEAVEQDLAARAAQPNTGVDPARVDGIEQQLAALKAAVEKRDSAPPTRKERGDADKELNDRFASLDAQIESLNQALADARKNPAEPKDGVPAQELNKRLLAMQEQLDALQSRPNAPAASDASQQRLDALAAKIDALEKAQQSSAPREPVSTGVDPARVDAIEKKLADLRGNVAKGAADNASPKEQDKFYKNFATQMKDLERQISGLDDSVAKAAATPKNEGGMASDELARRVASMQEQIDAVQARVATAAPDKADANAAVQARLDELGTKISAIQQEQAARPAPEVPEARFTKIEQQLEALNTAMQAPKDSGPSPEVMEQRFSALSTQLDALRGELDKQSKQLALAEQKTAAPGKPKAERGSEYSARPNPGEYRLGAGDKLSFQSFNDEKLSREELTVRFDGNVSLPLIPDIAVGHLTRAEAEERIREEYRSVFRDPQVALIVREAASKSFTIVGDIEKPGVYPYTTDTNLIEAISLAGGLRRRSSSSSVGGFVGVTGQLTKAFVVRNIEGERQVLQYDMRGLGKAGAHDSQAPIYYGDLVYVPEGVNLVYLLGESRNPVIVELTEGMKLLQLLALSGGFNSSTAKLNGVVLMRQMDENNTRIQKINVKEILRTGRDFELVPGDIVYIPRKRLIALQEFVQRFTGTISPVINLYTSAVNAYYARDLQQSLINDGGGNRTLETLQELESFGSSTANIVDLFGRPR